MKRLATFLVLAWVVSLLAAPAPADAAYYWFQVKDEQGRAITSGFTCHIYTVASRTPDALFTDTAYGTLKTNPVNPDSNGVCSFATSPSTVDVAIWGTSGIIRGAVAKVNAVTDKDHSIIVDTQNPRKHIRFFWDRAISQGAQVDTGIDLPNGAVVTDVWVEVATGGERMSVSVGLLSTEASGNTAGFCLSQGVDQAWGSGSAWFRCEASRTTRTAIDGMQGQEGFFYSSNTRGVLLSSFVRGQQSFPAGTAGPGTNVTSQGRYQEFNHFVRPGSATSLVYQTRDIGGAAGYVHIFYQELFRR